MFLWQRIAGAIPVAGGPANAYGTYHANYVDGSNSSSYSFAGVAIGAAAADRYVVIALGGKSTSSLSSISSATIGGVAMTVLHKAEGGSGETAYLLISNTPITTGTTATFAVTFNQSHSRAGIGSFTARSLVSTTPTDTGGTVGGDYSDTITISNGGVLFMVSFAGDNVGANNTAFTGIDEYFDVEVESGRSLAAGFKNYPTGGAQAVTAVITGSSQESHIAVSLR